jgi:hypothetical protein
MMIGEEKCVELKYNLKPNDFPTPWSKMFFSNRVVYGYLAVGVIFIILAVLFLVLDIEKFTSFGKVTGFVLCGLMGSAFVFAMPYQSYSAHKKIIASLSLPRNSILIKMYSDRYSVTTRGTEETILLSDLEYVLESDSAYILQKMNTNALIIPKREFDMDPQKKKEMLAFLVHAGKAPVKRRK